MAATGVGTFAKNSPDWQLGQLWQQVEEWLEFLLAGSGLQQRMDDWALPDWLLVGLFWLVLGSLLGWVGWQLWPWIQRYWQRSRGWTVARSPHPDSLPAPVLDRREWLTRSRLAQAQGNHGEACRALYMAMLSHLHEQQFIEQVPSRTDGEYLSLVGRLDRPDPYQILLRTHEQLCFGNASISVARFERCWQAYQEIDPS